jgi:predicted GNAT family N-acyltransferase
MNTDYFVFREIRTIDEMTELLSLRYQVYMANPVRLFIQENESRIDLDEYDLKACHFGLFRNDIEPMGYIRIISEQDSPQKQLILEMVADHPELEAAISRTRRAPLPFMTYPPDAGAILQEYQENIANRKIWVEPSRLVISPVYQSLKLVQHLVKSAIAVYFFYFKVDSARLCCSSHHRQLYQHYGFEENKAIMETDVIGISSCYLVSSPDQVPFQSRNRLMRMAEVFARSGQICYSSSHPDQFEMPDKTGVLSNTQVLVAA